MNRVLVLTTEPLPLPGRPATGAGLRAWGLAQGLRASGLDVTLLMPHDAYGPPDGVALDTAGHEWVGVFDRREMDRAVHTHRPDVIVLQHWGLARDLGDVVCPLAIDLAGPHLLERRLWGSETPERDLREKLAALRRADFLTASGVWQRRYFLPFLHMAGWPAEASDPLPVIPFAMLAAAAPPPPRPDRLIYGGYFLPWQDPSAALEAALDALERAGHGELLFIGGAHPQRDVSRGRFEPILERLRAHPQVRTLSPMPFEDYWRLLREGGVALDLMARNAERELAFTTRTVVYLAAGLPVVHDDYSELGVMIAHAGAGWAMNPSDREGLDAWFDALLGGAVDLVDPSARALDLVRRQLDWERTIEPLALFCHQPRLRRDKATAALAFERQGERIECLEAQLDRARGELATLRGKRWVRWGQALLSGRAWLRGPTALFAAGAALVVGAAILINDALARLARR